MSPETSNLEYMTVLRSASACRLLPNEEVTMTAHEQRGDTRIVLRTKYDTVNDNLVHREMWVEVFGPAASLDEAMRSHVEVAGAVVLVLTLATNAVVEQPELELCFDVTPSLEKHEFFQNGMRNELGLPRVSRHVDGSAFTHLFERVLESSFRDRLFRAMAQYQIAIQNLQPGREVLALAHLYMAMEVLTRVAREEVVETYGTRDAALKAWGIELKQFDPEVRRRILFKEDDDTYKKAKDASDGFEHGHMGFGELREHAQTYARRVATLVRDAVLHFAQLESSTLNSLSAEKYGEAIPAVRMSNYIRTTLTGDANNLAAPNHQYPIFRIETSIAGTKYEGETVEITPSLKVTGLFAEGITYENTSCEFWGPDTGGFGATYQDPPASQA